MYTKTWGGGEDRRRCDEGLCPGMDPESSTGGESVSDTAGRQAGKKQGQKAQVNLSLVCPGRKRTHRARREGRLPRGKVGRK